MINDTDFWRPIVGYDGLYEISRDGKVRNRKGHILAIKIVKNGSYPDHAGYPAVCLSRNGKAKNQLIHVLLLMTFVGPPGPGEQCRHLDGNSLNHSLSNLAWGTNSENVLDQVSHGTHSCANKTHCPRGHPYDEINTKVYKGSRFCRSCHRIDNAAYARRKRAEMKVG